MSTEFKPLAKPTSFDNVLVKDIPLTQFPKFLWQHMGRNGQIRLQYYFERKGGSITHPLGGWNVLKAAALPFSLIFFTGYLFEARKINTTFRAMVTHRYGSYEEYEKMTNIEKRYVHYHLRRRMN
eukprot:gene30-4281_t